MKFAQGGVLRTDSFAMFEIYRIGCTHKFGDFCFLAVGCVNDALAKVELFFDDLIRLFVCASGSLSSSTPTTRCSRPV